MIHSPFRRNAAGAFYFARKAVYRAFYGLLSLSAGISHYGRNGGFMGFYGLEKFF